MRFRDQRVSGGRLLRGVVPGFIVLALSLPFATTGQPAATEFAPPPLTNLHQVLTAGRNDEPVASIPVRVQGVVTHVRGLLGRRIIIHDGTNGCAVVASTTPEDLAPGQRVEVEGELATEPHYSYITRARISVVGEGTLPEPTPAKAADLAAGKHHAGLVRLRASVLDVCRAEGKAVFLFGAGSHSFNAWCEEPIAELPLHLLNATVEVTGVPWSIVSGEAKKPSRFNLHVQRNADIVVKSPGSTNLWGRPRLTLKQFADAPVSDDRHVIVGIATYVNPAGTVVIDDGTEQGHVNLLGPIPTDNRKAQFVPRGPLPKIQPGDRVEVVATKRRQRAHSPWLEWAEIRVIGRAPVPEPIAVTPEQVMTGEPDCRLVRVRARVVDYENLMQGNIHVSRVLAQFGERTTYVVFAGDRHVDFQLPLGATVELTGMPIISAGPRAAVRSFTFYVSDPSDIRVIPPPPPWRTPVVRKVAGGIMAGALLAGVWIFLLRRQVTARTAELAASNAQLQRNEQALQRALAQEQELNQLKANFVSMVSHEFRTPLGVIVSSSDILRRYFDRLDPAMRHDQLDIILRSTGTLSGLVEDLLLLGKVEAGKLQFQPEPLDLATLCRHLADEVLSATRHSSPVNLQIEGDLSSATGDEGLLRPALLNLLTNAVKYSPPGSPVDLRVNRAGQSARFEISDRGIGIMESDRPRLFAAFSRGSNVGDRPGTGLGLVIAKKCVELHGGTIEFASRPGDGTTFTVTIPLFAPGDSANANAQRSTQRALNSP